MNLEVKEFYDGDTGTFSYIVLDLDTSDCVVIDPVWNYDPVESVVSLTSLSLLKKFILERELNLLAILDSHIHADHLSGVAELKRMFPNAVMAIGENVTKVQSTFKKILNLDSLICDGSQFDILLNEVEDLKVGSIVVKTIFTPGHTPACSSYLIGNNLFVGDAIFMPDFGTGRCDFPGGSASELYRSISEKIYKLPQTTNIYVGHDYGLAEREIKFRTTVKEELEKNIHINKHSNLEEFVRFRTERDATLSSPKLLYQSLQVNLRGGLLPEKEENGKSYLKLPVSNRS